MMHKFNDTPLSHMIVASFQGIVTIRYGQVCLNINPSDTPLTLFHIEVHGRARLIKRRYWILFDDDKYVVVQQHRDNHEFYISDHLNLNLTKRDKNKLKAIRDRNLACENV
jgi:hypothetical protein